jgi:integrase
VGFRYVARRRANAAKPDGTPIAVQQKLMRHGDIRTTMNIYGDAATADMREAHEKVVRLALPRA